MRREPCTVLSCRAPWYPPGEGEWDAGARTRVGMLASRRHRRVMRIVLAIIGAILGLSLATGSHELFGLLLGAAVGLGVAELAALRVKLKELEDEVGTLR